MGRWLRVTGTLVVCAGLLTCSGDDDEADDPPAEAEAETDVAEPEVRDELLAMMEDDQASRTGGAAGGSDQERTARLQEIVAEHGWPTLSMVGKEGATAAWVIAQHADFDVDLQADMLALMVEAGADVDATEVAYLEDRVAVNRGEPQRYGTQVRCVPGGGVAPATPLVDEAAVDDLRAAAGMDPLADYFAEFEAGCEDETSMTVEP